jgi:hypothetical protein
MGFIYLEHGLTTYNSDAMAIHNNFIAECGNCIELRGAGQASKITDNLIGAGYKGYSIYAQNFGGLLISTNNIFRVAQAAFIYLALFALASPAIDSIHFILECWFWRITVRRISSLQTIFCAIVNPAADAGL